MLKDIINVQGSDMHLDDTNSLALVNNGIYEPAETKFIQELIKPGMKVLDIGAHIGYYTCMLSKLVGPTGRVYAFEPNVENYRTNIANQNLNSLLNVDIFNVAASNKEGVGKMYVCPSNSGDHRTFSSVAEPNRSSYDISLITIDNFAKQHNITDKIDFVKMDVQGYEGIVLEGMKEVLQQSKNIVVLTEFWPFGVKQAGLTSKQFLDVCLGMGFGFTVINNSGILNGYTVEQLISHDQNSPNWGVNIIWKR